MTAKPATFGFSEREITRIWRQWRLVRVRLADEAGSPLEIIYPGRLNDNPGADFCDAIITANHRLNKGDVEIHVKSSDWQAHGHQHDSRYNSVVLQVVMWHNLAGVIQRQDGQQIPTLALNRYLDTSRLQPLTGDVSCLTRETGYHPDRLARLLDIAGEKRFLVKASRFQTELSYDEPGQVLYQGIMEALGYPRNKAPFLELARKVPLKLLENQRNVSKADCRYYQQEMLLGVSGLSEILPKENPVEPADSSYLPGFNSNSINTWRFFKIRPGNSPHHRLIALTFLLARYQPDGLLKGLTGLVKNAPIVKGSQFLEAGLLVKGHQCLAPELMEKDGASLGKERVIDIISNVLLPFTFAWSRITSQAGLAYKSLALYLRCPRSAHNCIEKHMIAQLNIDNRLINSARRQQGLIHIYKEFCAQGRCSVCELSQLESR